MTRKKYALKYINDMTEEDKKALEKETKGLILPANLKSPEEVLYKRLEHLLKVKKTELKKEHEHVIDMFDLRNVDEYIKEKKIFQIAAFPEDLVLIPEIPEFSQYFKKEVFAKKIKVKKGK